LRDDGVELVGSAADHLLGIASDDSHFDIIAVDTVLHDVLERLEDHFLGFFESHGGVVLLLEGSHGSLLSGADGVGLPFSVGSRRIGSVKLGSVLVDTSDEESDTVGARHWLSLGAPITFSKVDGKVRDRLRNSFDTHGFVEVEGMVLGLDASVIDKNTSITNDSAHSAGAMAIDFDELLTAASGDHKFA